MEFRCIKAPPPNLAKWMFEKLTFPYPKEPAKPTVEAEVVQFILSNETPKLSDEKNSMMLVAEMPAFDTRLWVEWKLKVEE